MATIQQFREAQAQKNHAEMLRLAQEFVGAHPELAASLEGKSSDQLVQAISAAKLMGNRDLATSISMWELAKFERRHIGGALHMRADVAPALREV